MLIIFIKNALAYRQNVNSPKHGLAFVELLISVLNSEGTFYVYGSPYNWPNERFKRQVKTTIINVCLFESTESTKLVEQVFVHHVDIRSHQIAIPPMYSPHLVRSSMFSNK